MFNVKTEMMIMKLPETIAEWKELIELLESSVQALQDSESDLKAERSKLSLQVAMGDEPAIQHAEKLEMSGCRLALERKNNEEALTQARAGLAKAEADEAERLESERLRKVRETKLRRKEAAKLIDASMKELIGLVWNFMLLADELQSLGEPGHSKKLVGQLRRAWMQHIADSGINKSTPWKPAALQDFLGNDRETAASWRSMSETLGVE